MIIRILLIGAAMLLAVLALRSTPSSRGLALRRVALVTFTAAWITAVLSPDLLSRLALLVGVARGTDLLLYVFIVAVALSAIGVYKRFITLEQRISDLTRELAIVSAHRADTSRQHPPGTEASGTPVFDIVTPNHR